MFDKKYLKKADATIDQIRNIGLYEGDIVCIISDDLKDHAELPQGKNVIVRHFKEADKSKILDAIEKHPVDVQRKKLVKECFTMSGKSIHYHKFHCFHQYFKVNYKKCLYLDTDMQLFKSINKIINLDCDGGILAHSDAYPTYVSKLRDQFDKVIFPELFVALNVQYDLNRNYFQATMFLYDTKVIEDDTFDELIRLSNIYINSKTNDQAILNLYFMHKWKQIKIRDNETYYYDFWERFELSKNDYIMLKYPQT